MLKRISKNGYLNSALYYYNTDSKSIIRSKYSIKKIKTGIRATEYIINNILDHPDLHNSAKNYVTNYYTDHFFLLSRNTDIDKDKGYRRKLRKHIIQSVKFPNISFRTLLV